MRTKWAPKTFHFCRRGLLWPKDGEEQCFPASNPAGDQQSCCPPSLADSSCFDLTIRSTVLTDPKVCLFSKGYVFGTKFRLLCSAAPAIFSSFSTLPTSCRPTLATDQSAEGPASTEFGYLRINSSLLLGKAWCDGHFGSGSSIVSHLFD